MQNPLSGPTKGKSALCNALVHSTQENCAEGTVSCTHSCRLYTKLLNLIRLFRSKAINEKIIEL